MNSTQQKWNAEDYAKNSSAQLQWANELIAKLGLQGSESVLDIGCGDGKISAQLSQAVKNGSVHGIDLSAEMIALASEKFSSNDYSNLSFQQMNAAELKLPREFDVAFSNAALHWVKDHFAVLRGVRACLKSGGRMLLQMGGRGNAADVIDVVDKVIQSSSWSTYFEDFTPPYFFYGPDEYQEWLASNGFRAARVELIPKDMQHEGVDGMLGWLRTTWFPYTDRLPVELHEDFLAAVIAAYIANYPVDEHGNTHVKMVRLEVEAVALQE